MNHEIRAQLQWLLQHRCQEAVVDAKQGTAAMRDIGQRPDIGNLNQWIGRRLSKQQLRVRLNRRIPGGQVRQIDVTDADAELREELVEQTNRRAEQPTRTDDRAEAHTSELQ